MSAEAAVELGLEPRACARSSRSTPTRRDPPRPDRCPVPVDHPVVVASGRMLAGGPRSPRRSVVASPAVVCDGRRGRCSSGRAWHRRPIGWAAVGRWPRRTPRSRGSCWHSAVGRGHARGRPARRGPAGRCCPTAPASARCCCIAADRHRAGRAGAPTWSATLLLVPMAAPLGHQRGARPSCCGIDHRLRPDLDRLAGQPAVAPGAGAAGPGADLVGVPPGVAAADPGLRWSPPSSRCRRSPWFRRSGRSVEFEPHLRHHAP